MGEPGRRVAEQVSAQRGPAAARGAADAGPARRERSGDRAAVSPGRAPARPDRARRLLTALARVLLVAFLLVPAAFTLGARPEEETDLLGSVLRAAIELTPVSPDRLSTPRLEFVANMLLFLPLGVLLPPALPRVPLSLLLAVPVVGSLAIEVAQLLVVTGRTPDLVDVVANGAGGAVGLLLGGDLVRAARWWDGRPR